MQPRSLAEQSTLGFQRYHSLQDLASPDLGVLNKGDPTLPAPGLSQQEDGLFQEELTLVSPDCLYSQCVVHHAHPSSLTYLDWLFRW